MDAGALNERECHKGEKVSKTLFETVTEWLEKGFTYYNDRIALNFDQERKTYGELNSFIE